jgi:hypothetical protein
MKNVRSDKARILLSVKSNLELETMLIQRKIRTKRAYVRHCRITGYYFYNLGIGFI